MGKVLIDDVWSGGKPDGVHLLMSSAIDKGLYHPRCKDGHTTYFEGISDEGEPYTESERRELIKQYNAEQKHNYAKNQAEKFGRIAMYSLDAENKKVYAERAEKWREIAEESVDKSGGSGIIKAEIEKGNIKLEINHEKQARHIKGTPEYKEGKSYLTITEEEAHDIINAKSGTGTLVYDRKGNWKKKELIDCDKEVGVDVDENTKKETPTDKATVHYSKTGTHLVPRKEENHD